MEHTPKKKRRRFLMGTLVESTDIVNKAAHKFVVRVRYYANYSVTSDYVIEKNRRYLRE
jgi:hypothetical protein